MGQQRNRRGNKKYLETNENSNMTFQNLWDKKKKKKISFKREFYSNTGLPQKTRKNLNEQPLPRLVQKKGHYNKILNK